MGCPAVSEIILQWNLYVTTTPIKKLITYDLVSNVL